MSVITKEQKKKLLADIDQAILGAPSLRSFVDEVDVKDLLSETRSSDCRLDKLETPFPRYVTFKIVDVDIFNTDSTNAEYKIFNFEEILEKFKSKVRRKLSVQ